LRDSNILSPEYEIDGCVTPLKIKLDLKGRRLEMETAQLPVSTNPKGAIGAINWIAKQVKKGPDINPVFRMKWPKSPKTTDFSLNQHAEEGAKSVQVTKIGPPKSFVIAAVSDLSSEMRSPSKLISALEGAVFAFYKSVLRDLKIAKIPREIKTKSPVPDLPEKTQVERAEMPRPTVELEKATSSPTIFRILPIRERRYLDPKYN
jgi:hypothetical protein